MSAKKSRSIVVGGKNLPRLNPSQYTTEWRNAKEIMDDIRKTVAGCRSGKIAPKEGRLLVTGHRNALALLAIQLEHAKWTNRLGDHSDVLPGFVIG